MYFTFISGELKKWMRDPMTRFMLFYPVIFGLVGRYGLPSIAENAGFSIENNADYIIAALTLMMPMVYGALIGFSILDDRDDHIFNSIRITPLNLNSYLLFRLALVYCLSFTACFFVMWFVQIGPLNENNMILISFLAAFSAPLTGLLINLFATNKIEGFAIMKLTGIIILLPVISLYFTDAKELFFAFIPAFWPGKIISTLVRSESNMLLTLNTYFWIGLLYSIVLNIVMYRSFNHKLSA